MSNVVAMSKPTLPTSDAQRGTVTIDADLFRALAKVLIHLVEKRPEPNFDFSKDDLMGIIARLSYVLSEVMAEKEKRT